MSATPRTFSRNPAEWEALCDKHIAIVGLGSVGSAFALMAARAGVGRFTLIDSEVLDAENVGRHSSTEVGAAKVDAVERLIHQVNPGAAVSIRQEDFRSRVRQGFDAQKERVSLLVGATDSFECQSLVNLVSLESGVPSLYVGCWNAATVGEIVYVIPGRTACYQCFARFRRKKGRAGNVDPRKYTDPDFDGTKQPADGGLWANILIYCGFAFHVALALLGASQLSSVLLDDRAPVFFVNVAQPDSLLPFWRVSKGVVDRGCGACADLQSSEH